MIKILVVDDHALIRKGLIQLLKGNDDLKVSGEAGSAEQAIKMLRQQHFDLVLLDLSLPDRHGIDVLKQIKNDHHDIKVIVLTMFPEEQFGLRALKAGAVGYINKQSAPGNLVGAIRHVLCGKRYISETLTEQLLNNMISESQELLHQSLSNREYQTLCLMSSGHSLTEISEIMNLSPKTVSVYRGRMLEKMQFKNNAEAVHYAIANQLVNAKN